MKESQKLIKMEITRDDLLNESEHEVDSTTEETPIKKPKVDNKKKGTAKKKAKIDAMRGRAREMFATLSTDSESEEVKRLKMEVEQLKCKLQSSTPPEKPGKRMYHLLCK